MKKEFVNLIKNALHEKEISLRELARKSNLDVSFLSKILNGKRNPPSSENDIKVIAKVLQIKPDRLFFAAGRIPSNLQEFFNDKKFIEDFISAKKTRTKRKAQAAKVEEKPVEQKVREIEDELL